MTRDMGFTNAAWSKTEPEGHDDIRRLTVMVPPAHSMSQLSVMSMAWALSLRPQKMAEAIRFEHVEPPEPDAPSMSRQQRRYLARKGRQ